MEPQKFEISGEIESTEPKRKGANITGRFFLLLFVIAVVGAALYFPFLQQAFPVLKKYTLSASAEGLDSLQQKNRTAQHIIDSLQHLTDSLLANVTEPYPATDADNSGLYYKIQIGAFKNFDLKKYKQHLIGLQGVADGEFTKLTLGKFRDIKTAREFLNEVREMGFKDAWVVAEKDGVRVPFDNAVLGEEIP